MGLQRLVSLAFLFNSFYVILNTLIQCFFICVVAFDQVLLFLEPPEKVREIFPCSSVCNKLIFFFQNLLDFSFW